MGRGIRALDVLGESSWRTFCLRIGLSENRVALFGPMRYERLNQSSKEIRPRRGLTPAVGVSDWSFSSAPK